MIIKDGSCGLPMDCDFEKDECLWKQVKGGNDDFDWLRGKGGTQSRFTGPRVDHTLGTDRGNIRWLCLFLYMLIALWLWIGVDLHSFL